MNTTLPLQNDVSDLDSEPDLSGLHFSQTRFHSLKLKWDAYIAPNFGYFLLVLAQLFNSVMIITCKLLVTDPSFDTKIHPLQILFVRMAITYVCCLVYMAVTRTVEHAPFGEPAVRKWLVLRGVVGFTGVFGLYFSLQYLSVSDAVAITFSAPLITAFLAFVFLHERYTVLQGVCSVVSLGGVLLIAKPSFIFGADADNESVDESVESSSTEKRLLGSVVGLLGAVGASSVFIILKKIGDRAHPLLSVSYFALATVIVTATSIVIIPSVSFAVPKTSYQWFLFWLIGITGFFYQFALTAGVQRVKASKAALVGYTQMIFAIAWDLLIWHHFPELLSVLGILIIVGCTVIVIKQSPVNGLAGDLEQGTHQPLPQSDDGDPNNKPDSIALQDFVITDDEDEDSDSSPEPRTRPSQAPIENQLNSMKYSASIKLNSS